MSVIRALVAIPTTLFAMVLVLPVVALALPFWAVTILTRTIYRMLEPPLASWDEVIEYDAAIGWKPKSDLDTYYVARGGDNCRVLTDHQGWPGKSSVSESEVIVFGDSFAFAYGVDADASYSAINPYLSIKGIGAPGYSMVQELLLMRQLSTHLKDKLVVWFICLDNDLYDNLKPDRPNLYTSPFVRSVNNGKNDWEIVTDHVSSTLWHSSSAKQQYYPFLASICTPSPISQRAYSACDFLIRTASDVCKQADANLIVMTIPNKNQLSKSGLKFLASQIADADGLDADFPDRNIGDICANYGVKFVPLKHHLSVDDYKVHDVHWNERGHRRVSEVLADLYRQYTSAETDAQHVTSKSHLTNSVGSKIT